MPTLLREKINVSPETQRRDFELWQEELNELPALQSQLGRVALEGIGTHERRNHDPLAHVWQLAEAGRVTPEIMTKIKTEFVPDMGERSPDNGFYHLFSMHVEGNDLVSATGVSMRTSIAESVTATRNDARDDSRRNYGLLRELVQEEQIDGIVNWAKDSRAEKYYGFASLCPDVDEVPIDVARTNGFKPDRLMASIWIYEKTDDGLVMHALSFDHCTLDRYKRFLSKCGLSHDVKATTMDELGNALSFNGVDIETLRNTWSEILLDDGISNASMKTEANGLVESRPEAFKLYMKIVVDVTASLRTGHVNKNLSRILRQARKSQGASNASILSLRRFRTFDTDKARELMEFVRSRMIPHYIYGDIHLDGVHDGTEDAVLMASGSSAMRTESYDGACPSSNYESQTAELSAMSSSGIINRQLVVDALMKDRRRGDCMTCGAVQTSVYGCGLCSKCNKVWCDEYKITGRGLEIREIVKRVGKKKQDKSKQKT
jgi:hypothetical protein